MSTATYPPEQLSNGFSPPGANNYTNGHSQPMDGRPGEFPPSGLTSPFKQSFEGHYSEETTPDHASAAAQYSQAPDVKFNPTATPTSEYGLNTSPARTGQYPDYLPRAQYPDGSQRYHSSGPGQGSAPANMAQTANPSMAPTSPTYPQHHYTSYSGGHDPHYAHQPSMYPPHHYGPPHPGGYAHGMPPYGVPNPMGGQPGMVGRPPPPGGHPLSTIYSFVPIPGTHQQKRPRRRYEEIERMYKCGHGGCGKAYGTLNHLNAHVTMQSHGNKRTPEEFKEIRKEWKQRKKDEDNARKADDERARQGGQQSGSPSDGPSSADSAQATSNGYPQPVRQLPPLGYVPAGGQVPPQYAQPSAGMDGMPQYQGGYYPPSPYGQGGQMYQANDDGTTAQQ